MSSNSGSGKGRVALVTGLTGQDGSYMAELLLEKGYEAREDAVDVDVADVVRSNVCPPPPPPSTSFFFPLSTRSTAPSARPPAPTCTASRTSSETRT